MVAHSKGTLTPLGYSFGYSHFGFAFYILTRIRKDFLSLFLLRYFKANLEPKEQALLHTQMQELSLEIEKYLNN